MSDDWEYNDDDQYGDSNSGGSLRAQLEKVLKENKALKEETAGLKGQITERAASDILRDKGYPPAVGRLAVKDGVDLTDEKALDKWLADNGDLFVKPASEQSHEEGDSSSSEPDPAPPEGVEATYGALGRIHSVASPASVNRFQQTLQAIPENASPEQVREFFKGL